MTKSILTTALFFLPVGFLLAQSKGIINYKCTTKTPFGTNNVEYAIYFNSNQSIEFVVPGDIKPSAQQISETEYVEISVSKRKNEKEWFVLKDFKSKKLVLGDFIEFNNYLIYDTLNNFKWKITSEHQKILNYTCTKAILNFRGRNYIAFFTETILLPYGPWKFCGLPGLIVKISDSEDKFVYELTGIDLKAKFDDKIIKIPLAYLKDKPITQKQFIAQFNKKVTNYAKMAKVVHTGKDGSYGSASIILPEKMEKL